MTNNHYAILAEANSRHIRITHTLSKGQPNAATLLLKARMVMTLDAFRAGELEDIDLVSACEKIDSDFGPIIYDRMWAAAREEIRALQHA